MKRLSFLLTTPETLTELMMVQSAMAASASNRASGTNQ